jgi:ATP-dependent DNA helicase RecG
VFQKDYMREDNKVTWTRKNKNQDGLIEGEVPHYIISLSIAKNEHQLPSYTKTKGLDKEKLRQMILQFLQNAGGEGAKQDGIYEYLRDVLPSNKTDEHRKHRGEQDW